MSLLVKVGQITEPATATSQGYNGVGFTPKVLILTMEPRTSDGTTPSFLKGYGFATSTTNRAAANATANDNVGAATAHMGRAHSFTHILYTGFISSGSMVAYSIADLVSFDADGFTLNFTTVTGSQIKLNYIALAGDELSNAFIKQLQVPAATGSQGYTGVGFKPDSLIVLPTASTAAPPAAEANVGARIGFSFVDSDGTAYGFSTDSTNASTTHHGARALTAKAVQLAQYSGGAGIRYDADFTSYDNDGFTLNWTTISANAYVYVLCLKGVRTAVGVFNQNTTTQGTGNQSVSGIGVNPKLLILASVDNTTSASAALNHRHSFGAGTSSTERFSLWSGETDAPGGTGNSIVDRDINNTKIIRMLTEGTPTLNTSADLVSLDQDGFTINNDTVDATAREILYFGLTGNTLTINVSDNITVTDIPQFYEDTIYVSEAVQVSIETGGVTDLNVNVSDNITVTESVTTDITIGPNVSDTATVTESVTGLLTNFINVSDTATLTESVTATVSDLSPNVSDNITVAESVNLTIPGAAIIPNVNDSITVTESVSVVLPDALKINVSDNITVTESVNPTLTNFINVSDTTTLTESVNATLTSFVNVSDTATITEAVTGKVSDPQISVSDNITLTESVATSIVSQINVSDNITVTEAVTITPPTLNINVSDNITVSESINVTKALQVIVYGTSTSTAFRAPTASANNSGVVNPDNVLADDTTYAVYDTITDNCEFTSFGDFAIPSGSLIKGIEVALQAKRDSAAGPNSLNIFVYKGGIFWGAATDINSDTETTFTYGGATDLWGATGWTTSDFADGTFKIQIGDFDTFNATSVSVDYVQVKVYYQSLGDTITVTESVSVAVVTPPPADMNISVEDNITVTESVNAPPDFNPNVSDNITLTESATVAVQETGTVQPSAQDTITVTESVVADVSDPQVSATDNITLTESVVMNLIPLVSATDNITVTESVSVKVSDPQPTVQDNITVTEAVTARVDLNPNVSDTITLTEAVALALITSISVQDTITVTEAVALSLTSFVNVSDNITVTEAVALEGIPNPNVSDTITVSENVAANIYDPNQPNPYTQDNVTVTESVIVQVSDPQVNVSDTTTLSESVIVTLPDALQINVSDTATLTESVGLDVIQTRDINVSDTITVTEAISLTLSDLQINVSDNITISESVKIEYPIFVSVQDSITVTESVNLVSALATSVSENVTVTESVQVIVSGLNISVSEAIAVAEAIGFRIAVGLWLLDTQEPSTWTTEAVPTTTYTTEAEPVSTWTEQSGPTSNWLEEFWPATQDATQWTTEEGEIVSGEVDHAMGDVAVSENVTVSESITLNQYFPATATENVAVTENINVQVYYTIPVSDTITVTESVSLSGTPNPNISDTVTVSEAVLLQVT